MYHFSLQWPSLQHPLSSYKKYTAGTWRKSILPIEKIFLLNQRKIIQAARAMFKLSNSAEQSVNLPARGRASRGGSLLFICNKVVGRSHRQRMYTNIQHSSSFKWLQASLSDWAFNKDHNNDLYVNCHARKWLQYPEGKRSLTVCFRSNFSVRWKKKKVKCWINVCRSSLPTKS